MYATQSRDEIILYGVNVIDVLLTHAPHRLHRILYSGALKGARGAVIHKARALNIEVESARERQIEHYLPEAQHQGVMAFVKPKPLVEWSSLCTPASLHTLVALDQVTDPRNFGAILRSAESLGVKGVLITSNRCARPGPLVAKTSAGASELIPIAMETNLSQSLEHAQERGYQIVGADREGSVLQEIDWSRPSVIVIGAEGKGMREKTRLRCDVIASIPHYGQTESLNASVAAGIIFYESGRKSMI